MRSTSPLLSVRGLARRFGDAWALDSVDFDLWPGEILGIIGPNGAGKTTLMECLVGLLPSDAGEVRIDGRVVAPLQRREHMFCLPDGIAPWDDQAVWRVTGLFREMHVLSLEREAAFYSARERAVLAWAEAVTLLANNDLPDALYDEVRAQFDDKSLVDLTLAIITINGWNRLAVGFRAEVGSYQTKALG